MVEVGERNDQIRSVFLDERGKRGDVTGVGHERDDRPAIGRVEGRRELVHVDRDGGRAGIPEGGDDVDSLAGAGEEDRGHGAEGYSAQLLNSGGCARWSPRRRW